MKLLVCSATAVLALTLGLRIVHASGPIGVYALVDKVQFEPRAEKPERVRISGVFITADGRSGEYYSAPQRGYLYFTLPRDSGDPTRDYVELARREWADLKAVAGTRQVVAFGSSWGVKVRVRKPDEEAKAPDDFPMGNGVTKVNPDQPRAIALLDYKGR
jgi:hypothetical protein